MLNSHNFPLLDNDVLIVFFFELKDNVDIFINEKHSDLIRFRDVFVKWGVSLNLIDRFQLKNWTDVSISPRFKIISCVYLR